MRPAAPTIRTVHLDIAVNGAFLTRRWSEPDNWMRLTHECGFPAHSFCADVIDPFFSGDRGFQSEQARAAGEAAGRYGITICDLYTGVATHRFHGLSHTDSRARARMRDWILAAADIARNLGTDLLGGHWDAFPCEVLQNPALLQQASDRLVETFRELSRALGARGIRCLMQEQMYVPSEKPWTLGECEEFLRAVNTDNSGGIPVRVTLDVGHQAGSHYGLTGEDLDYTAWLRRFACMSEVIHLQQTTADASHHWPFTPAYNRRGHVDVGAVLEAIRQSHDGLAENPLAGILQPVDRHWLVAEIIPGSTKTEAALIEELTATAAYLRRFIPAGGLEWSFRPRTFSARASSS